MARQWSAPAATLHTRTADSDSISLGTYRTTSSCPQVKRRPASVTARLRYFDAATVLMRTPWRAGMRAVLQSCSGYRTGTDAKPSL